MEMGMLYIVFNSLLTSPRIVKKSLFAINNSFNKKYTKCSQCNFQGNKTEPKKLYTTGLNDKLYSVLQKEVDLNT